ncbi:DUF2271 domain-containing protein [Phenylobacterium sp.]|uniref:DUF2271 domain-containing protein n=1 Tax=Phenylobacterium sp. TaxID=1871053 RepID=UPI00272F9384|nr:DUF2271 domain-containing protein [Phenylobacterium sp.]MDP1616531.1 DUF2271 domain-containing protein [Phenylobacterium sp.]MDP1986087.1 DUF2271 domain-containing protein [Phenylobacterium sp.]
MRRLASAAVLTGLMASPAAAAELNLSVEIPRLSVAEYHNPYVAVWVEKPDQTAVKTLAVWYDIKLRNQEGETWLKDMRQWWRRAGRAMTLPADGVSGATKAPGRHQVTFVGGKAPLGALPAGQYNLVVEAAREVGGREMVRIPFQWPPKAPASGQAKGATELGAVSLNLKP